MNKAIEVNGQHWLMAIFLFTAAAVLLAAGCGETSERVDIDEIPLPAGIEVYEGLEENTLDAIVGAYREAYLDVDAQIDVLYLLAPETMTWSQALGLFEAALGDSDGAWAADADVLAQDTARWTRGSGDGKQTLVVTMLPAPSREDHIVIMILVDI